MKFSCLCLVVLAGAFAAAASEPAPDATPPKGPDAKVEAPPALATPAAPAKPTEFKDTEAGYSVMIPAGYTRLADDRVRLAFKGLSSYLGKDVSERTLQKPPACFQGPVDPAHPRTQPPGLAIGYSALSAPVDPAQMNTYKEEFEQEIKKSGENASDVSVEVVSVNGIPSLRVEHDIFSPVDNTRMRMIKLSVPGHQRRYDIVFSFFTDQAPQVKEALETITKSFATFEIADPNAGRWTRVALWTGGGLIAGLLLGVLLGAIAGNKQQPAKA